MKEDKTNDI